MRQQIPLDLPVMLPDRILRIPKIAFVVNQDVSHHHTDKSERHVLRAHLQFRQHTRRRSSSSRHPTLLEPCFAVADYTLNYSQSSRPKGRISIAGTICRGSLSTPKSHILRYKMWDFLSLT